MSCDYGFETPPATGGLQKGENAPTILRAGALEQIQGRLLGEGGFQAQFMYKSGDHRPVEAIALREEDVELLVVVVEQHDVLRLRMRPAGIGEGHCEIALLGFLKRMIAGTSIQGRSRKTALSIAALTCWAAPGFSFRS